MLTVCIFDCLFPSFYRSLEGILSQVCLSLGIFLNVKYFCVQFSGDVVVVPQQCTGFSGITGPEETDTTRGPFRQPAKEVDSLSMCVNESQQCAGRFGHNKGVYPSLCFLTGAGICTPIKYSGWFKITCVMTESKIKGIPASSNNVDA